MNNLNDKYHLIQNSNENFCLFELDPEGSLLYRVFNSHMEVIDKYTISDSNVIKFNVTLDDSNRLILIYLLASGDLYLSINDDLNWTESKIGSFDTKSNIYHQFELVYINNRINLIYSFSNYINSEIISIQHMIIDKGLEEQNNVIKYLLRKSYNEFFTGFDHMGTIHLVYNTRTNFESYVYHSFYSPYSGTWTNNPHQLSSKGVKSSSPYLFIDSKSNINSCWLEVDNNKYRLKYSKMPIYGKDKYIWQEIIMPLSLSNQFTPLIYEEDGLLKILSYNKSSINTLVSDDFGNTWSEGGDRLVANSNKIIAFTSSKDLYPGLRVKNILALGDQIYGFKDLYLDFIHNDNDKDLDMIKESSDDSNIIDKKNEDIGPTDPLETNELKEILYDLIGQDLEKNRLLMKKILENQEIILNDLKELKKTFEKSRPSLFDKLFREN